MFYVWLTVLAKNNFLIIDTNALRANDSVNNKNNVIVNELEEPAVKDIRAFVT